MSKDAGFKVVAHMTPDLPHVGLERDLEQFKALAISRLAAQHDEITRLRRQATAAKAGNVRTLAPRLPGGTATASQETS